MIKIEEYIKKRKNDEKVNEFDLENKNENMQLFISYVIEYFNTYVDIDELKREMLEEDIKLRGYNKLITEYSLDIQEWLLKLYATTGHRMHKPVQKYLDTYDVFLLINDDNHFKKVSYKCFASLGKKYKQLEDNLTWLQELIRNEHEIKSNHYNYSFDDYEFDVIAPSEKMTDYVIKTLKNHKVNLFCWAEEYVLNFDNQKNKWPAGHKLKTEYPGFYRYDYKSKKNLFNIDVIYPQVSHLPYLKGKKKMLESLLKIMWTYCITDIDDKTQILWQDEINNMRI